MFSLAGIFFAIFMVFYSNKAEDIAPIPFPPAKIPYNQFVAGEGIIESASENVFIGTPFNEIVETVSVHSGDLVKKADPLFILNTDSKRAALNEALKKIEATSILFEQEERRLSYFMALQNKAAVSKKEFEDQLAARDSAFASLELAKASAKALEVDIERSTIRAPFDGIVLEVNVRPGQTASTNPFDQKALILFGKKELNVRINVDESDIPRVKLGAEGILFIRGSKEIYLPIKFIRVERNVRPKLSLSGNATERVDTRVLQLIYAIESNSDLLFVGQMVDCYMESKNEK